MIPAKARRESSSRKEATFNLPRSDKGHLSAVTNRRW
jgi:hypothetical protein